MFGKFMNKKDFHPGSKWNIKKVWMAEQKLAAESKKQKELRDQYDKEQEKYSNRALVSKDEKLKMGLNFMYDAPPGFDKDKSGNNSKNEDEDVKFEWQKGAPRAEYAKDLSLAVHDQPFGIPVRNVKCIKCGKWGHINTDRECPLFNMTISSSSSLSSVEISDPARLMKEMRKDGLALKQAVLGRSYNTEDPNQQIVASDEEDDDPEAAFLSTLSDKQKRKLLRKLDKLEKKEEEAELKKEHKKNKKKKKQDTDSDTDGSTDEDRKRKHKKKKSRKQHSGSDSDESDSNSNDDSRHRKYRKNDKNSSSRSNHEEKQKSKHKRKHSKSKY